MEIKLKYFYIFTIFFATYKFYIRTKSQNWVTWGYEREKSLNIWGLTVIVKFFQFLISFKQISNFLFCDLRFANNQYFYILQ